MGKSKKVTVGYKYYAGIHMALCHGPVDFLIRIEVDDKQAWPALGGYEVQEQVPYEVPPSGDQDGYTDYKTESYIYYPPGSDTAYWGPSPSGRIEIKAYDLFGGTKREGGIEGDLDFEGGEPDQGQNDYLLEQLGDTGPVPNFRGVCCAVLRQMYLGINPYLKPWKFRVQRIHSAQDGTLQWYDAKAPIGVFGALAPTAIYFALDGSGSMAGAKAANQKIAVNDALDVLSTIVAAGSAKALDIHIITFSSGSSIERRDVDVDKIEELKAFVNTIPASGGTSFTVGVSNATAFFAATPENYIPISIFVTDGNPDSSSNADDASNTLLSIPDILAYGVNIDLEDTSETAKLDNTPQDGVPIVSGDDSTGLTNIILNALSSHWDMNPAHIIRECLTNNDWGLGIVDEEIDEDSYIAAADTLYDDRMGISILWTRSSSVEDFIGEILRHIEAESVINNSTGQFGLKLIRDDYDEETLTVLGPSEITEISDFSRVAISDLINEVTVEYWDSANGVDRTVTVQNLALIQAQGGGINTTKVDYPGFSNPVIAGQVAARDLQSLSYPRASCTIIAKRAAGSLNKGDAFKLSWPKFGIGTMIMRVTDIDIGDGVDNKVTIGCTQDTFSLPTASWASGGEPIWKNPNGPPTAATLRLPLEAPYFELVQILGQVEVDDNLAVMPEAGYIAISADEPSVATINAALYTDSGAGYVEYGNLDFCEVGTLTSDIGKMDTVLSIQGVTSLSLDYVDTWIQIDDELMSLTVVTSTELTVKRGLLDTTPADHLAGANIWFWDNYAASDEVQYLTGDEVSVKLQTVNSSGVLDITTAPVDVITLDHRAIRPYAPANVKINDEYFPTSTLEVELSITWAHRDRLAQTTTSYPFWTDGDIGPEAGTTYTGRFYDHLSGALLTEEVGITSPWIPSLSGNFTVRMELEANRDGFNSWQRVTHVFDYGIEQRTTEEGIVRITEDGITFREED